jgi:hypothetical protein
MGYLEAVQVLLEAGADLRAQQDGAIWFAAEFGRLPVVRHLLLCSDGELHQETRQGVVSFLAKQSSEVLADMLREAEQRCHHSAVRLLREAAGRS